MQFLIGLMKANVIVLNCAALFVLALACSAPAAGRSSADEQAIRDLDARWSSAVGAKDLEKSVSYYAESAIVLPTNGPAATTRDAIRNTWKDMLASPGFAISWKTTKVEVAKSGDLAYATGTYELTMNDPSGKPINDRGKYVEVWRKQAGGKWKCTVDIWNSDLPAAMPVEKK